MPTITLSDVKGAIDYAWDLWGKNEEKGFSYNLESGQDVNIIWIKVVAYSVMVFQTCTSWTSQTYLISKHGGKMMNLRVMEDKVYLKTENRSLQEFME